MVLDWISFDCYGTLVDWEKGLSGIFSILLKRYGVQAAPDGLPTKYILVEREVEREPFRSYREVLIESTRRLFRKEFGASLSPKDAAVVPASLPTWPLFPDTKEALYRLKGRRRLAILSNTDDDLIAGTIEGLGVPIDEVVTAQQVKSYKPAPRHWEEALRRLQVAPDRLLHAAASLHHDIEPAGRLGVPRVWINRKAEPIPPDLDPSQVLPDLASLADRLDA